MCIRHRRLLQYYSADRISKGLIPLDIDDYDDDVDNDYGLNDIDDFEEIILYQMTMKNKSARFTSKFIQLMVVEDSFFSVLTGLFEMVVADTTEDVIILQMDLGTVNPDIHTVQKLMRKFRFGTVWNLKDPDFHMEKGNDLDMYIRYEVKVDLCMHVLI